MLRTASSLSKNRVVDSVVVGGGPCGLAVVGNLLEQRPLQRQLWVDPVFKGGRVGAYYREVPSNTKVALFLDFAKALAPFREILESTQQPNAATALQNLVQDQGCDLDYAAELCLMLTKGVETQFDNVDQHQGKVTAATLNQQTNLWTATLDGDEPVTTSRLVLCTGSSPIANPLPIIGKLGQSPEMLHLDIALKPSQLAKEVNPDATVAVVGASHSAILVLMNLYNLASTTHPNLRIKWFTRHKDLRYAEYKDGWILYDNTGLKGQAAQWARENLDEQAFINSPVSQVISKHFTPADSEDLVYQSELPGCTNIVQAIGYKRNPLPELTIAEKEGAEPEPLNITHDDLTGRFTNSQIQGRTYVPGLFGAGIAFPERVTDPMGNVEHAVGFWKFMRFLRKTVPEWVESTKTA